MTRGAGTAAIAFLAVAAIGCGARARSGSGGSGGGCGAMECEGMGGAETPGPSEGMTGTTGGTEGAGKILWTSAAWANGHARKVADKDPEDPLLYHVHGPGWIDIDGAGNGKVYTDGAQGSIRFFIAVPNRNTEITGVVIADDHLDNFNMNHRNNHIPDCGFGGYQLGFQYVEQAACTRKEIVHAEYSSKVGEVPFPMPIQPGKRYAFKTRVVDMDSGGAVHFQIFWDSTGTGNHFEMMSDYVEDGHIPGAQWESPDIQGCIGKGYLADKTKDNFNQPNLNMEPYVWFRFNAIKEMGDTVNGTQVSNLVIREVPAEP